MNRYNRYPGDYMRDTIDLSMLEDGAYTRLLDWYYANERPIEDRRKFAVARATSEEERQVTQWVLDRFFRSEERDGIGVWVHDRAEAEIGKARPKINASRNNGKHGGRPKKTIQEKPSGFSEPNPAETQQGSPEKTHSGGGGGSISQGEVQEGEPGSSFAERCRLALDDRMAAELKFGPVKTWSEVIAVCAAFERVWGRKDVPRHGGDPRAQAILGRGAEGASVKEMIHAIEGSARAVSISRTREFQTITTILRDAGQVDKFMALLDEPHVAVESEPPKAVTLTAAEASRYQ